MTWTETGSGFAWLSAMTVLFAVPTLLDSEDWLGWRLLAAGVVVAYAVSAVPGFVRAERQRRRSGPGAPGGNRE